MVKPESKVFGLKAKSCPIGPLFVEGSMCWSRDGVRRGCFSIQAAELLRRLNAARLHCQEQIPWDMDQWNIDATSRTLSYDYGKAVERSQVLVPHLEGDNAILYTGCKVINMAHTHLAPHRIADGYLSQGPTYSVSPLFSEAST